MAAVKVLTVVEKTYMLGILWKRVRLISDEKRPIPENLNFLQDYKESQSTSMLP